MRHDSSIPTTLHAGTRDDVKDALGAFWSSVFADQELVDGLLEARVLSACQKYIDAMEALSLRDHGGMPVFHREHWHPVLVRMSERNTASPLVVGMRDAPVLGPQPGTPEPPEPPEPVLPEGYALVDWIESYDSLGQHTDTGYVPNSKTVIRARIRPTKARSDLVAVLGLRDGSTTLAKRVSIRGYSTGSTKLNAVFCSSASMAEAEGISFTPGEDYTVELRLGRFTVYDADGAEVGHADFAASADAANALGITLYLFCEHSTVSGDVGASFQNVRIYSVQIYETEGSDEVLKCDFRPCRDPDNAYGMYDVVRGQYYPNLRAGTTFGAPTGASASAVSRGRVAAMDAGTQEQEESVYLPGEVFEVGGNALYSKVNTYPLKSFDGCRLVSVRTGLFDSISRPRHMLSQGRDFDISGDVLVIRKEHDPFDAGGYRVVEDGDDRVAVLWACDAEYDTDNVRDFLAYPLGFDVDTSPAAARMLSALWDTVVYGLTSRCLNSVLGALFDVPVVPRDTVVESVEDDESAGTTTVVTSDDVYVLPYGSLLPEVAEGARLHAGDFLVRGVTVRHGLSKDEVAALVADGSVSGLTLLPGSVRGVDVPVVLESMWTDVEDGGWFKLNSGDSAESPFWSAVRSHASAEDLARLCEAAKEKSGEHAGEINPVLAFGYLVLANTILVESDLPLSADPCTGSVFAYLQRLVPAYASLLALCRISVDEPAIAAGTDDEPQIRELLHDAYEDTPPAMSDSVACTMVPIVNMEV